MEAVSWGLFFCVCNKEPSSLEGHGMRDSLSPSEASTPLEAMTGQVEETAVLAAASSQPLGAPAQGTDCWGFRPISDSDQPRPWEPGAAATLWPNITWGMLLAKVPKPQGRLGTERWFWRVQ